MGITFLTVRLNAVAFFIVHCGKNTRKGRSQSTFAQKWPILSPTPWLWPNPPTRAYVLYERPLTQQLLAHGIVILVCDIRNFFVVRIFLFAPGEHVVLRAVMLMLVDVKECEAHPCMYNGTCIDTHPGFVCNCTAGARGPRCQYGTMVLLVYLLSLVDFYKPLKSCSVILMH